jgi:hypothetical protein
LQNSILAASSASGYPKLHFAKLQNETVFIGVICKSGFGNEKL